MKRKKLASTLIPAILSVTSYAGVNNVKSPDEHLPVAFAALAYAEENPVKELDDYIKKLKKDEVFFRADKNYIGRVERRLYGAISSLRIELKDFGRDAAKFDSLGEEEKRAQFKLREPDELFIKIGDGPFGDGSDSYHGLEKLGNAIAYRMLGQGKSITPAQKERFDKIVRAYVIGAKK